MILSLFIFEILFCVLLDTNVYYKCRKCPWQGGEHGAWCLRLDQLNRISLITKNLILIVLAALRALVLQKNIIFCLFVLDVLLLEKLTKSFKNKC